ncbi:hypothetical protein [Aporhodopirellula aestuarii]|uniref:DUF1761 domain-containing protein n=1 Tax=Aporhodopirellula aestuarii TaxID=2950107 RepID=A0ABT0U6W5_9BACT|nr:hypothetical protein [Aporhodopirellula aestuarii]MCM2372631.1 hypothetical protein [Aporhodopirellula aestuarii]
MTVFDLWLPIVLSGLATHILSTLNWMVFPHHKPEWQKLPAEDQLQDMVVLEKIPAGQYMLPFTDRPEEMKSEAFQGKQAKCTGMLILWERPINMMSAIGKTIAFFMVAAFVIGYLASLALAPGASFGTVMQFVVTAGLLTHCAAHFPHVFWFKRRIAMELLDGVVYAVVTGLIFAIVWPSA